ncbi:ImmA/IrrE family metallo-endopeptidase [Neobacillus sp. NPDC058068]|uniref:ImmA/IrrE family metallo-endopeptidase n=1 Tax=Neobacillus sp. NPDC058068 TaxID=3346325 RepID=UPI0036DF370A
MWIKDIVKQLTGTHKTNDPFAIAELRNIQVILWNLHQEIKGFYKYDKRNKYIFINNNLDEDEQKFVCAHELGHAQLHPRVNTPFLRNNTLLSVDRIEIEANRFAVELLMPDAVINEYQDSNLSIYEICEQYSVPRELAHVKKF